MVRDKSLDGLKFLLIFSVILVHMQYEAPCGIRVAHIQHMLDMPMFIFLSGYFTKVKTWEKFFQSAKKVVEIYLIFDVLHSILSVWLYQSNFVSAFAHGLIKSHLAMWYLMSLLWWRALLQILANWKIYPDWKMLLGGVVLSLLAGFVPLGKELSFQRTFTFLPFFLMGYMAREGNAVEWVRRQPVWPFAIALVASCCLAHFLPSYMPRYPYADVQDMLVRGLLSLNAFVLCVSFFRVLPTSLSSRFAGLGELTMYFFLYHTLFLVVQRYYFAQYGITINFLEALLITGVYIAVIYLMSKMKLFRWLILQ